MANEYRRVENALLAAVVKDNRILSRIIETEDPVLKKVGNGLRQSAPFMVDFENEIKKGNIPQEYSLEDNINQALELYERGRKSGQKPDEFINQTDMLETPSETTVELYNLFNKSKGAGVIKDVLKSYEGAVNEQENKANGTLDLGIEKQSKTELLKKAIENREGNNTLYRKEENFNPDEYINTPEVQENIKKSKENFSNFLDDMVWGKAETGRKPVVLFKPTKIWTMVGLPDKKISFDQSKIRTIIKEHGLTIEDLKSLPEKLANPEYIFESRTDDTAYVGVLDRNNEPFIAVVKPVGNGLKVTNIIKSAYNKDSGFVNREIQAGRLLYDKRNPMNLRPHRALIAQGISSLETKINISPNSENVKTYYNLLSNEKQGIYRGDKSNLNIGENEDFVGKAKNLQSITNNLVSKIDIPVRKGKMFKPQSVRGFFRPIPEVIRVRSHNDISTVAHELGHGLEKRLWGHVGSDEITKHYDELKKIASKSHNDNNPHDVSAEGFAEFISYFVIDPEYVKKETPKFYEYFNKVTRHFKEDAVFNDMSDRLAKLAISRYLGR